MKALILNSGLGKRMGTLTSEHPKCMTELSVGETIVSRQLRQLAEVGITDIVMTTGPFVDVLEGYIKSLGLGLDIKFVNNPIYDKTNYIYSIYMARELLRGDDLILMHGDLVFENSVLDGILAQQSAMTVSSTVALPVRSRRSASSSSMTRSLHSPSTGSQRKTGRPGSIPSASSARKARPAATQRTLSTSFQTTRTSFPLTLRTSFAAKSITPRISRS